MSCLPQHGRIQCTACFKTNSVIFDKTQQVESSFRITANPLSWGNPEAEIVILGFSKGPAAAGASLSNLPHNEIAYANKRTNVGKILSHVGLIEKGDNASLKKAVNKAIADKNGKFHFGSLIRCGVEQNVVGKKWRASGDDIISRFFGSYFGKKVSQECSSRFLGDLPSQTKLVIMFGMGTKQKYVNEVYELFQHARPGTWRWLKNNISYTDDKITVVHVEHFSSRGNLIPNWLGEYKDKRNQYGIDAKLSVEHALGVGGTL